MFRWLALTVVLMATPYLKVSPNARYLIDAANGSLPFLVHGDSPLELPANLNSTDLATFLDDRQTRGFNALLIELARYEPARFTPADKNLASDRPFDASSDFAKPTAAYWTAVDAVITGAASRGMVVFAYVAYAGAAASGSGYYDNSIITAQPAGSLRAYGRFLGNRYQGQDNIVWCLWGGRDPGTKDLYRDIVAGIVETDTVKPKLITAVGARGTANGTTFLGECWYKVNAVFTVSDHSVFDAVRSEYALAHRKPVVCLGGYYEGENSVTAQGLRRQAWWSLTSGAAGHFFGNGTVWKFSSGWQSALASTGATHIKKVVDLLSQRSWQGLIPDTSHVVVTGGFGTDGTDNHATAARSKDGSLALCYVPTATSPVVAMAKFYKAVTAQWYDPTNGSFTAIAGSPFANTGSQTIAHPGANAAGDSDWVLVLETDPPVAFLDNFDGATVDATKWDTIVRHGDYGNSELQCYQAGQAVVASGKLTLTAEFVSNGFTCGDSTHTAGTWSYRSAMIQSKFTFTYGTIKVRAKLPGGAGPWPAVWLLGTNCQSTNPSTADNVGACSWPNPGSNEIDIIEAGQQFGGVQVTGQGFHSTTDNWVAVNTGVDLTAAAHDFEVVWSPGSLVYKVDGVVTRTVTDANVPSTAMFIIANLAVGGNGGGTPTSAQFPRSFEIESIQVTQ